MTPLTILKLGRVSNLPTVWTNALAGAVLAGASGATPVLLAALALTLFYIAGMWLNDAFDADIDARERANRPIPMGEISRLTVFAVGGALLVAAIALTLTLGEMAGFAGIALAIAIVLYDWVHKKTVLAPAIMGAARFFSYAVAALAVGAFAGFTMIAAFGLFCYVVGLTFAARQEAFDRLDRTWPLAVLAIPVAIALYSTWGQLTPQLFCLALIGVLGRALWRLFRRAPGDVPRAVVTMIAGISLYDGAVLAGQGFVVPASLCVLGFVLTLALQRIVSGT